MKIKSMGSGQASLSGGVNRLLRISLIMAFVLAMAQTAGASEMAMANRGAGGHENHVENEKRVAKHYTTSTASYEMPGVALLDSRGEKVLVASLVDSGRPVMINFIFTSCRTICPVMVATFAEVQRRLGETEAAVDLISISIDPEFDTPTQLASYTSRLDSKNPWHFLTGEPRAIRRVEEAFDIYRGDKMNHTPVTFVRAGGGQEWLRIEGFPPAADLVREYRNLLAH